MTAPLDTAQIREDVAGEFLAGVVYRLCDEVDRLRDKFGTVRVLYAEKLAAGQAERDAAQRGMDNWRATAFSWGGERDALRKSHSALLRRLRDEMNAWQPEHPGAKECATRVLRALGDEVGD